jgi:hypothetical protein
MLDYEKTSVLTFKKQNVKFNPFEIEMNTPSLYCSDPWGAVRGHINKKISGCSSNSKTKRNFTDALYYIKQAEQFFIASEKMPLLTKNTVLYYSMMNIAKCLVTLHGKSAGIHHGLTVSYTNVNSSVNVLKKETSSDFTFHNFTEILGCNHKVVRLKFEDICENLIEVHNLNHSLSGQKLKYLPIGINLREYETTSGTKNYFTSYSIKNEDIAKYTKKKIEAYLLDPLRLRELKNPPDGYTVYRDSQKKLNYATLNKQLKSKANKLRKFKRIASVTSPKEFKYYAFLGDRDYNHLSYSYLTMFLLGHIARYNPKVAETYLRGENYSLITEITNLCPLQFIYQVANLIAGTELLPDTFRL